MQINSALSTFDLRVTSDLEKGSGTKSAKHPAGRWRLLMPDPYSPTFELDAPLVGSGECSGLYPEPAGRILKVDHSTQVDAVDKQAVVVIGKSW